MDFFPIGCQADMDIHVMTFRCLFFYTTSLACLSTQKIKYPRERELKRRVTSNKWCLLGPHKLISNIYVSMHNTHAANSYESTNAGAKKSLWEWQLNVCFVFVCLFFLFSNFITLSETSATRTPDTVKLEVYLIGLPLSIISFIILPPSFVSPGDIASNFRAGKRAPCRWTKDITKHSLPSTANPHRSQGKHFIRRIIDWIQSFMFFPNFILEMGKKKVKI